jgi:hypothetical protein
MSLRKYYRVKTLCLNNGLDNEFNKYIEDFLCEWIASNKLADDIKNTEFNDDFILRCLYIEQCKYIDNLSREIYDLVQEYIKNVPLEELISRMEKVWLPVKQTFELKPVIDIRSKIVELLNKTSFSVYTDRQINISMELNPNNKLNILFNLHYGNGSYFIRDYVKYCDVFHALFDLNIKEKYYVKIEYEKL